MPLTRIEAVTNLSRLVHSQNERTDIQAKPRVANENSNNGPLFPAAGEQATNRDMLPRRASSSSSLRNKAKTDVDRQSDTFSLRRTQTSAQEAVKSYLMHLQSMMSLNREPELRDMDFLPLLIKSENRRDPRLNLRWLSSAVVKRMHAGELMLNGVAAAVRSGNTEPWRAVLDDCGHRVAISVRHASDEPGKVSIVMLDSMPYTSEHDWVAKDELPQMTTRLLDHNARSGQEPLRIHLYRLHTEAQRAEGCCMFALSAAKKAATSVAVAQLHEKGIEHLKTTQDVYHTTYTKAFTVLEASFFKHATSGKTIQSWRSENPEMVDAPVNKHNETLAGRYERYLTDRISQNDKSLRYSKSIEVKRIDLLDKALKTLGDELEDKPLSYFADEQLREAGLQDESIGFDLHED